MMKILSDNIRFLLLLALIGIGAISCSKDMEEMNAEAEVTFTATLQDDLLTRSFGEGLSIDRLVVGVFDVDLTHQVYRETFHVEGSSVDVQLSLPRDQAYRFVFWAYNSDCSVYNMDDLRAIKMIMETEGDSPAPVTFAEVENSDAFFATYPKDDEETGENKGFMVTSKNPNKAIELTRPLAQINVGTSGTAVKASFTVGNAADTFYPFTETVSGEENFTWTFEEPTAETFSVWIDEKEYTYNYLALGYLFAPLGKDTEAVKKACLLELTDTKKDIPFQNVELHANRRSNIVGSFTE